MPTAILILGLIVIAQWFWISKLRNKLKDANWKLPARDRFHGDIF